MQWSVNVPPTDAPIGVLVRASDKRLLIQASHAQLRSNTAIAATAQVGVDRQRPQQFVEYEWLFPRADDVATSERVDGSSTSSFTTAVGPMQPAGLPGTAVCEWHFRKGGASDTSSTQLQQRIVQIADALDPQTRAWIAEQARVVAKDPSKKVDTVEASAHVATARDAGVPFFFGNDLDVDTLIVIVMMGAAREQDDDIRDLLEQMNATKDLRSASAQITGKISREASALNGSQVCATPQCQSLAATLAQLANRTPQFASSAKLAATGALTQATLQQISAQLKAAEDGLGSLAADHETKLQSYRARQSKVQEALAEMLEKMSDTAAGVTSNLK
jgi:hypothetical protein